MQRFFSNDQAITPDRQVRVVFDPDETVCTRLAQGMSRQGGEIARGSQVGVGSSSNVDLVHDVWMLSTAQTNLHTINEETDFQDLVVPATAFNYAVPFGSIGCPVSAYNNFRAPDDISGVTLNPAVQPTGDTFTRKDITAGYSTGAYELTDDLAQFPKPPPCIGTNVPVDRLAVGTVTYPENCGFHLRFVVPGTQLHAPDVIGAFYFGGNSGAAFNPSLGFALVLFGNGEAELWELSIFNMARQWGPRCRFTFSPPNQVAGYVHGITIQPHGRNTISFRIASASRAVSQGRSASHAPSYASVPPSPHAAKFEANALVSGYVPGKRITGAGNLRLDVRRDLLLAWQISILDYASTGLLVDHEILLDLPLPGGTILTMATNVIVPDNCFFDVNLYAADDVLGTTPLSKSYLGGSIWQFSTLASTRAYFAAFAFTGDPIKHSSPQFKRYSLEAEPAFKDRPGLNVVFPVDQTDELAVSISGQDGDPSHETMHLHMINLDGSLTLPRRRGRLKTRVDLGYVEGTEVKVCRLFDGQGVAIEREPFGAAYDNFSASGIDPTATLYEGEFVGRWARGHESFMGRFVQLADYSLAFDIGTGTAPPRSVSEVIYDVFVNVMGVPPVMLDIPEFFVPFAGPEIGKDVMLHPKQNPMEYILHLVTNYLGAILFFDPNAVPRGRWRIQPKLELFGVPEDPLWRFWFGPAIPGQPTVINPVPGSFPPPLGGGGPPITNIRFGIDPVAPETYGDGGTFIERGSYFDWIEAPEYNFIKVAAPNHGSGLPNEGGPDLCIQIAWNPDSFDLFPDFPTANPDPDVNPHYVGEMLPLAVYDPAPTDGGTMDGGVQDYVNFLAYYLLQQYGLARKLFRFRAPLVLAQDLNDPYLATRRPMRHNDPVWVGGLPAILRRVDPEGPLANDFQMAWYTGVFKNVPVP